MSHFSCFQDLLQHLDSLGLFHMDFGLSRVEYALDQLKLRSPSYGVIHVVGTNGKGSTSRNIAELAKAHGFHVGLYSSPHFLSPRERILIDGAQIAEDDWVRLGNDVMDAASKDGLTYFEFLTVLAILAYARAGVDLAIMEAGLGGKYDAANAIRTDMTVYTSIGLDHTAILGDSIQAIATDKAGAMRPEIPVISTSQCEEAETVLRKHARATGAPFSLASELLDFDAAAGTATPVHVTGPKLSQLFPTMQGPHQQQNSHLALAVWLSYCEKHKYAVNPDACAAALATARVPGRFQHIPGEPEYILDGAHNPQALNALARTLEQTQIAPKAVIFACLKDKDLAGIAPAVASFTDGPLIIPELPDNERARSATETAAAMGGQAVASMKDALELTKGIRGPVLICGSLYLLSEFFKLRPQALNDGSPEFHITDR